MKVRDACKVRCAECRIPEGDEASRRLLQEVLDRPSELQYIDVGGSEWLGGVIAGVRARLELPEEPDCTAVAQSARMIVDTRECPNYS